MNPLLNKRINSAVRLAERKANLMNTFVGTILQSTILQTESTTRLKSGVRYSINTDGTLRKKKLTPRSHPYYGYTLR
ncbi:hypothetical protein [Photobacterium indicum]|uniref:hypothetical protein n=1 Tax=Photobacterium indicum TaxID=81447 RepID=UPI003D0BE31F